MGVNNRMAKQRLKPFRHFLPERFRGTRQGRALGALSEETQEGTITGASAIVIGNCQLRCPQPKADAMKRRSRTGARNQPASHASFAARSMSASLRKRPSCCVTRYCGL